MAKNRAFCYLLPLAALIGVVIGIISVYISHLLPPTPSIPFPPPPPPFDNFVAGEGLVEASSEDIEIGTPFSEIVDEVFVQSGDTVSKEAPLFKLNTESLESQLEEARSEYEVSQAEYQKQLDLPRPEDVPPMQALVDQAEVELVERVNRFELVEKLENPKAVSRDEYIQRKYAALFAKYKLVEADENLNLLLAGAWVRDLEIYRAQVKAARDKVAVIEEQIRRSTIRAPFWGTVMRLEIRKGEFAQAGELKIPLVLFGVVDPLHIRVDIDEEDAWRVIRGAPGMAYVRGNRTMKVPLRFVAIEPYLIPKLSLTGDNTERVDTRVLQVLYELEQNDLPIYPGMLMDVFLEAKPYGASVSEE